MKKRIWIPIVSILAGTAIMFLLLVGGCTYTTKYRVSEIDRSVSPDGTYEVLFQNVGEPDFPFGNSHARLVLKRSGKTVSDWKFDVANDGGVLQSDNWAASWKENAVEVIISGEEQGDDLYTLYFDGRCEFAQLDMTSGEWK